MNTKGSFIMTRRTSLQVAPTSVALTLVCLLSAPLARAAVTDIAQVPLVTSASATVKPNVMFILDDSGSMASDYMPDDANWNATTRYGRLASQCNGLAYNPSVTYTLPVDQSGASLAAGNDAFGSSNPTPYFYTYSGTQPKLSFKYSASGVDTSTTFYRECNSSLNTAPGSGVFTLVNASSLSGAAATNYQIWYTYYRTRITMMKSAMSLAFKPLDDKFRVGFTTISSNNATPGTKFLDINTFNSTQKSAFYTALNNASPGGNTPLRGALSKAGRYFANRATGQAADPVQYACQKNFTILSTDGYWNTGLETSDYTALTVTGTAVGQQDGAEDRPMRDAASASTTTVSTWNTTRTTVTQVATTTTSYSNASTQTTTTYSAGSGSRTHSYSTTLPASTSSGSCTNNPKTCTVTVSTSSPLTVGTSIYVVGASPAAYGGAATVTSRTASQYTYTTSYSGSRPSALTAGGIIYAGGGACSAGQVNATDAWSQTDTFPGSRTTTTTASVSTDTSYTQSQRVTVTPMTETKVVSNGVTISDTTVAGTPVVTNTALTAPANTTTGPTPTTVSTSTAAVTPVTVTATGTTTGCVTAPPTNGTTTATVLAPVPTVAPSTTPTTLAPTTVPVTTTLSDATVAGTVTSTSTNSTTGGSSNSLADVAEYYFKTDLRSSTFGNCQGALGSGTDVCQTTNPDNTTGNTIQNMITFTIGLGTSGTLTYDKNYKTQASGDYFDLIQGTKNWPIPTESTNGGDPTNIDDLWHAAVNGRGRYFSAGDPNEVVNSLSSALIDIAAIVGSSSAAATSSQQPVAGDNDIFSAQFTSGKWTGTLLDYTIDPSTGAISTTSKWDAAAVLDQRINAGTTPRRIYYFQPAGSGPSGSLRAFTYANLTADSKNTLFDSFCSKSGAGGSLAPLQCGALDAAGLTGANSGSNLVSYLTGTKFDAFYRPRDSALGDIVNSTPVFVGKPTFKYTENGYQSFVAAKISRPGAIYVGANDGMLHAFDRDGNELWAYVPSMVLPNLYKLADTAYPANHQYYVDGSPVIGDIYTSTGWKTILVGGLGGGGRGYYALDITDPTAPLALWEFTDSNLGLTYGNPVITKRANGTWVVAFGSGYNNVSPGDGNGRLYILNANTGQLITTQTTASAGTTATPSGLSKINAWVDSDLDNTAKVFYGGDLLGNLWRFDIDGVAAPANASFLLARLNNGSTPQPITIKPQLGEVNQNGTKYHVVYIGTGRYLGGADFGSTDLQSIYAIKDDWTATSGLGDARASGKLVTQTLSAGADSSTRTASNNAVDWVSKSGWMVDLTLSSGERVNVNMSLSFNILTVASNVPTPSACDAGGQSWLYRFDVSTGRAVPTASGVVGTSMGQALIVGMTVVQLTSGQTVTITSLSDTRKTTSNNPPPPASGTVKRTSWRELAN